MVRKREPYWKDCALPLQSDRHPYDKPGTYAIMVKFSDIFGNDTWQASAAVVKQVEHDAMWVL